MKHEGEGFAVRGTRRAVCGVRYAALSREPPLGRAGVKKASGREGVKARRREAQDARRKTQGEEEEEEEEEVSR